MTTILAAVLARGKKAKGYVFGAQGPDYYDCSGLVYMGTKDAGVYEGGRFTTYTIREHKEFNRITAAQAGVDDIVVWSENSAHGHMGVISGPDQFYSAHSPTSHPQIGYGSISGFHVYPVGPTYYRPVKSDGASHGSAVRQLELHTPNMYGNDVRAVQEVVFKGDKSQVDGFYGPKTEKAVEAYQKAYGLHVDGIVGPFTRAKMGIK
jgi:cell wall-associated NlpC family hydrolase